MENENGNIPIFNFIASSLKEKNNDIKENILLGNINFPSSINYLNKKNIFDSENHKYFLNYLSNELSLIKIKEEKNYLNNKIEITNNKINYLKKNINSNNNTIKNIYNRYNNNNNYKTIPKSISSAENINILPLLNENKAIKKKKINLIEIKPIIKKNYITKNKLMNNDLENDLEQNAKEFVKRINISKINNLSAKRQKQEKDYLRLKKQIEIMDKKRKMREEFEFQRKKEENTEKIKNKNNNNISNIKFPNKKYHYYNKNKNKVLLKNFTDELTDFNSHLYYNNNYPYINPYHQVLNANYNNSNNNYNEIIEQNSNKRIITEVNNPMNNNNMNIMLPEVGLNATNEAGYNDSSLLREYEKRHIYYFNELKYEN